MTRTLWSAVVTAGLLAIATPAQAQSAPSPRADAEAIVTANGFEAQLEAGIVTMLPVLSTSVLGGIAEQVDEQLRHKIAIDIDGQPRRGDAGWAGYSGCRSGFGAIGGGDAEGRSGPQRRNGA